MKVHAKDKKTRETERTEVFMDYIIYTHIDSHSTPIPLSIERIKTVKYGLVVVVECTITQKR